MSRYRNRKFLSEYIKLDKECALLLKIDARGVSEYITRISSATDMDGREEALTRLTKYRSYRNKLAHEVGALSDFSQITREDIKWVTAFTRKVKGHTDPLSRYAKYKRKSSLGYKFKRAAIISLTAVGVAAIIGICIYFGTRG